MITSRIRRTLATTLAMLCMSGMHAEAGAQGAAQWKPDRTVTMIVPYSPGGGVDAMSRAVARELSRMWAQPVIVENLPGADGLIGTRKATAAKPDGLTLLVQIPSITVIRKLPTSKGFDPVAQLVPVSAFSSLPGVFVVNPKVPGKTMADVIRHCKTGGQACAFGTTENIARLSARMLSADAGIDDLTIVPYKGGGQLITDLVANNVNMAIMGIAAAMPYYKAGSLKILATLGDKRAKVTAEVPSAAEAGFPDLGVSTWYGVFVPKGTPAPVVDGIAKAVQEASRSDAVLKTFGGLGAEPIGNSPAEFAAMIRDESQRIDKLVQRFPLD